MNTRIFQASQQDADLHDLIPGLWYFWDDCFRNVQGGYKTYQAAEAHMKALHPKISCPTCED